MSRLIYKLPLKRLALMPKILNSSLLVRHISSNSHHWNQKSTDFRSNNIDIISYPQEVNSIKPKTIFVSESSFDYIRLNNGLYVDIIISLLVGGNEYYFLVRPRRFGKSLLCSTLSNLFGGKSKEGLYEDLWIGKSGLWDFEKEDAPSHTSRYE